MISPDYVEMAVKMGELVGRWPCTRTTPRCAAQYKSQSSPEHTAIRNILSKWTNLPDVAAIVIQKKMDGRLQLDARTTKCQGWLRGSLHSGDVSLEGLQPIALLQAEVKPRLRRHRDADEAEATKYLADAGGVRPISGEVRRAWNLDGSTKKDCQVATSDSRDL